MDLRWIYEIMRFNIGRNVFVVLVVIKSMHISEHMS